MLLFYSSLMFVSTLVVAPLFSILVIPADLHIFFTPLLLQLPNSLTLLLAALPSLSILTCGKVYTYSDYWEQQNDPIITLHIQSSTVLTTFLIWLSGNCFLSLVFPCLSPAPIWIWRQSIDSSNAEITLQVLFLSAFLCSLKLKRTSRKGGYLRCSRSIPALTVSTHINF